MLSPLYLIATGEIELGGMTCQQMLNQGNGNGEHSPLTDSLVSAIADGIGVRFDQVTVWYVCEERRAMSLSIRFSITLLAADLESTDVTAGAEPLAQQLVSLLDSAVSSGTFATSVSDEAAKRGEIVAVKATILESICLICDTEQVTINNIQVSESVYMGIVVLLLLVAVLLFFGELAILLGFNTLRVCQTGEQPSSDRKQPSCQTLTHCQISLAHYKTPTDTGEKVSKEEWVTHYGSDVEFDLYDAGGGIASGKLPCTPSNLLCLSVCCLSVSLFVCLFGTNAVWLRRRFKKNHGCQTVERIWNALWVTTIIAMLQLNCFVAGWY